MQKTLIYVDINTKSLIYPSGELIAKVSDYPVVERGQWQVLCFQFVTKTTDMYGIVTVSPATLSNDSSYILVGDSDFDDSNQVMFKSAQSTVAFDESNVESNRINIEGDWIDGSTADVSIGQMSVRVNSDTVKFTEVMSANYKYVDGLYMYVKQYMHGLSNPSTVAIIPFVAVNTIRDWSSTTEQLPEGVSVVPFVVAAIKNPLEFQFSVDGVTWHEEQHAADVYYRQRISAIDGEWSTPIKFVRADTEGGSTNAADIIISTESEFYAGMDVASALQTIGAELDGLEAELESI